MRRSEKRVRSLLRNLELDPRTKQSSGIFLFRFLSLVVNIFFVVAPLEGEVGRGVEAAPAAAASTLFSRFHAGPRLIAQDRL